MVVGGGGGYPGEGEPSRGRWVHAIQGSSFLLKLATICKGKLILSGEKKDILIRYWTHGQTLYSTRAGTQVHKRHGDAVP